jgi:hypothetical protein
MILDVDLQKLPSSRHVNSDGSGIGGVDPLFYGSHLCVGPEAHESLLLYSEGNTGTAEDYPAWMWYLTTPRPILPNTGRLMLTYDFSLYGADFNTFETDILPVVGGKKYQGSGQYVKGVGFQTTNAAGQWVTVGFDPVANLLDTGRHTVSWFYELDTVGETMSTTAIVFDSKSFQVAVNQKIPATPTNWADNTVTLQLQLGSTPAAPWWMARVSKLGLGYS